MIEALYAFLKGLGFSDPLHAPIVHIPIGLVIGALVFFVVALVFKRQRLVLTARDVSILALVFAFPSILFGVLDWVHFYHAKLIPAIQIKMALAAVLLVLLSLGIILGGKAKVPTAAMIVIYSLSFIAVVALGYYGATLVYGGFSASASASGSSSSAEPAGYEQGKALFADNCQACHSGGGNTIVSSLPIIGSKRMASLEPFQAFLRTPAMPDGKSGDMPAFGPDVLGPGQVKDLYAYLKAEFK
jgi:mono/diheme cytochrome c family protein